MINFKNRRVRVSVGETIKIGDKFGEFMRFDLAEEADIADEDNPQEARDILFKELIEEVAMREAAVKALHDKGSLEQVIEMLRKIFSGNIAQASAPQADPPVKYYGPMDFVSGEE